MNEFAINSRQTLHNIRKRQREYVDSLQNKSDLDLNDATEKANFKRIMREARIESCKDPVSIFGVLAHRYDNKEQVEQTLRAKLGAVRELERDLLDELKAEEFWNEFSESENTTGTSARELLSKHRR